MDIIQIQEKKNTLERHIEQLTNEFERDTQTIIERIELDKIRCSTMGGTYCEYVNRVILDVRLKERL
jgi:hypothetical protein